MKLQKWFLAPGQDQKQFRHLTRIVSPLVLAFLVFGFFGLLSSGQASAKTISTPSTCGNVIISSLADTGGYSGATFGILRLVENTCTHLYHGEYICQMSASIDLELGSGQGRGSSGIFASYYNDIKATCSTTGQIIDTAPHAKDNQTFCAFGNGTANIEGAIDGSLSWTC